MGVARVNWEGNQVVIILPDDKTVIKLPWQDAKGLANAIRLMASKAEEWENKEQIIKDQAVLTRANWPLGLSSNPHIKEEALKMAQNDRDLRRYMKAPTVHSGEVVNAPIILQPKTPLERLEAMTPEERAAALHRLKGDSNGE